MLRFVAIFITLAGAAGSASGHALMTSPSPRNDNDGIKSGPCGGVAPVVPHVYQAGQTITVEWLETVDHPGYYRIAFSPAGDDSFEDNVLVDDIEDVTCSSPPCSYSAEVTLPSEPCESCALQLIQFMGTGEPYSPYFSCTDVTLAEVGDLPDAGGASSGDAGPASGSGRDSGPAPSAEVIGGCSSAAGGGPFGALSLLLLVVAGRRRTAAG